MTFRFPHEPVILGQSLVKEHAKPPPIKEPRPRRPPPIAPCGERRQWMSTCVREAERQSKHPLILIGRSEARSRYDSETP